MEPCNASADPVTEQMNVYGITEIKELNSPEDIIKYTYECFMQRNAAAIKYKGTCNASEVKSYINQVFLIDNPTIYDAEGLWGNMDSYQLSLVTSGEYTYIFVKMIYKHSEKELISVQSWIDESLKYLSHEYGIYEKKAREKAQIVHDHLVREFDYDTLLENNDDYLGISSGRMVCQGYALLYCKMMNLLDVPCKILLSESHSWNAVCIDGEWLQVDVSGDDIGHLGINTVLNTYFLKKRLVNQKYAVIKENIYFFDEIEFNNITSPVGVLLIRIVECLAILAIIFSVVSFIYFFIIRALINKTKKERAKLLQEFKDYNSV